jgi:hypothetical protein
MFVVKKERRERREERKKESKKERNKQTNKIRSRTETHRAEFPFAKVFISM